MKLDRVTQTPARPSSYRQPSEGESGVKRKPLCERRIEAAAVAAAGNINRCAEERKSASVQDGRRGFTVRRRLSRKEK